MIRMNHLRLVAIVAMIAPLPAYAQVIEIDAAGDATTYDGPTMFTATDAVSLRPDAKTSTGTVSSQDNPVALIEQAARIYRLDPSLLKAVAWQESRGRMAAVSNKGARGVMQLMPATALELGVDSRSMSGNIHGGANYLRQQIDRFVGFLVPQIMDVSDGARIEREIGVGRRPLAHLGERRQLERTIVGLFLRGWHSDEDRTALHPNQEIGAIGPDRHRLSRFERSKLRLGGVCGANPHTGQDRQEQETKDMRFHG